MRQGFKYLLSIAVQTEYFSHVLNSTQKPQNLLPLRIHARKKICIYHLETELKVGPSSQSNARFMRNTPDTGSLIKLPVHEDCVQFQR